MTIFPKFVSNSWSCKCSFRTWYVLVAFRDWLIRNAAILFKILDHFLPFSHIKQQNTILSILKTYQWYKSINKNTPMVGSMPLMSMSVITKMLMAICWQVRVIISWDRKKDVTHDWPNYVAPEYHQNFLFVGYLKEHTINNQSFSEFLFKLHLFKLFNL